MSEDRTLWLEYPFVGGQSVDLAVRIEGPDPAYWRQNSLAMRGEGLHWVAASGVENVERITIPMQIGLRQDAGLVYSVSHADDDAEEQPDGSVNLTSSDLELVTDSEAQVIGVRFEGIDLPPRTTVRRAVIQFTCDETSSEETELIIEAEDSAETARFANQPRNLSARRRTAAKVAWTPEPWTKEGVAEEAQQTPDLAALVQEVVNRPDWKTGNPLSFLIRGKGKRVAAAYKENASAARLLIDADRPKSTPSPTATTPHTVRLHFAEPLLPKP